MHVGKVFPRFMPGWFDLGIPGGYGPARKTQIFFYPFYFGSLASEWALIGGQIYSDVGVSDPADPAKQTYIIQSPVNVNSQVKISRTLVQQVHPSSPSWEYLVRVRMEMILSSVVMGWFEFDDTVLIGYQGNAPVPFTANWNDLVNPAVFTRNSLVIFSTDWDEQPEYHPYRH